MELKGIVGKTIGEKKLYTLFYGEKHGRYSTERPPKGLKYSIVSINKEFLIITIKDSNKTIKTPLNEIDIAGRVDPPSFKKFF